MNNTHPNPVLQYVDDRGVLAYKPAYELSDENKERDGRNKWSVMFYSALKTKWRGKNV